MSDDQKSRLDSFLKEIGEGRFSKKEKGSRFEAFVQWYISASSNFAGYDILSVEPYPTWARRKRASVTKDYGVDFVVEAMGDGRRETWAVQVKFKGNNAAISVEDVRGLLGVHNVEKFDRLVIVSSGFGANRSATHVMTGSQKIDIIDRVRIYETATSAIPSSYGELRLVSRQAGRERRLKNHQAQELLAHQVRAVEELDQAIEMGDSRVQFVSACGTGKTVSSWHLFRKRSSASAMPMMLFAAPRLSLLAQTIKSYTRESDGKVRFAVVCSDPNIGQSRSADDDLLQLHDLRIVASSPAELSGMVAKYRAQSNHPIVVMTTNRSAESVAVAQEDFGLPEFDLAFCDESHYLVGTHESSQAHTLSSRVRSKSTVFATATPRITVSNDRKGRSFVRLDSERFGPISHSYPFGNAIEDRVLVPYTILAAVTRAEDARALIKDFASGYSLSEHEAAAILAVKQARDQFGLKRFVSFHSRRDRAREFAEALKRISGIPADFIQGTMGTADREARLDKFLDSDTDREGYLLANARILVEGIDIPSLDAVVFVDPMRSISSIAQAAGRVLRRDPDDASKVRGYIIMPAVVDSADIESVSAESDEYKHIVDVLLAMAQQDKTLYDRLLTGRTLARSGTPSHYGYADELPIQDLTAPSVDIDSVLARIETAAVYEVKTKSRGLEDDALREVIKRIRAHGKNRSYRSIQEHRAGSPIPPVRLDSNLSHLVRSVYDEIGVSVPASVEAELSS